jgi:hypothetical protein
VRAFGDTVVMQSGGREGRSDGNDAAGEDPTVILPRLPAEPAPPPADATPPTLDGALAEPTETPAKK